MSDWKEGDVLANGIRMHYTRAGTGRGPVLVLLHGLYDSGLCWTPVSRALEHKYDIVMLDARGHGLSEAPVGHYGESVMAQDVLGVVDALELDTPVLMGHSMGGYTAVLAIARSPERFRAAILEDPPLVLTIAQQQMMERIVAESFSRLVGMRPISHEDLMAIGRQQSPTWSEAELVPWATSKLQFTPGLSKDAWDRGEPWQEALPRITCPVLLISADPARGSLMTAEDVAVAAGLLRHGHVAHIPGAGHNIRREQFGPYMQVVREFLSEMDRR